MTPQRMAFVERILRYGFAGGLISAVFTSLVVLLVHLLPALGPVGASMLAFCLTQPIGYMIHRSITYPDAGPAQAHKSGRWLRFLVTNVIGLTVSSGAMALATHVYHASYLWGIALTWALIPAMNFVIYLTWVFNIRVSGQRICS
jgi:putative flippase GtrA